MSNTGVISMEYKLELTHQNGKISVLKPIKFSYDIIHQAEPEFYDNGSFAGYRTDHYSNIDISKLWNVQKQPKPSDLVEYTNFKCKFKKEQCEELLQIFNLMQDKACSLYKCDIVSNGKLNFINEPIEMEILGIPDTVSKIDFELLNVVPTCITDDSEIYLQCDLVKIYVDK